MNTQHAQTSALGFMLAARPTSL